MTTFPDRNRSRWAIVDQATIRSPLAIKARGRCHGCADTANRLALLAAHLRIDLDALALRDSVQDREPTTWAEMLAAGLDPRTGETTR